MKKMIPFAIALFAWGMFIGACKDAPPKLPEPTPEQKRVAARGKFQLELDDCVEKNGDDYSIEMCFRDVFVRWGKDAGAFK